MIEQLQSVLNLLCCPDDGHSLKIVPGQLNCTECDRAFPIHSCQVVELLPCRPVALSARIGAEYRNAYLHLFNQPFEENNKSLAWGAPEAYAESWVRKRERQVVAVGSLVTDGVEPGSVLCDIAAGAGYYTFAYHRDFHTVLHCDLSVDNLNYTMHKARKQGLSNIVFLRIDYFQPPFRHSLDRIVCLDTLIRGEAHDSMLLRRIAQCLKPSGRAVVDFHNWWHNPLRRLGVLPENFRNNRSYSRSEIRELFRTSAIQEVDFRRFVQEFDSGTWLERTCSWAVPATRFLYQVGDCKVVAPPL